MSTTEFSSAVWQKSSRSNGGGYECVEVAVVPGRVGVRDSKDRSGPALMLPPSAWRAFMHDVQVGSFDHG
jgi:hypothetical protein